MTEPKAILTNYHALVERQYVGDTDAICTLMDLASACSITRTIGSQAIIIRKGAN